MTELHQTHSGEEAAATDARAATTAQALQLPRGEALTSALTLAQIQADPDLSVRPLDDLICTALERAARAYGLIQETVDTPPVLRRLLPHALQLIDELQALSVSQPVACREYLAEAERRQTRRGQARAADVIAWCVVNQELENR